MKSLFLRTFQVLAFAAALPSAVAVADNDEGSENSKENPNHPAFPHPVKNADLPAPTSTGSGPTVNVWPNHGARFAPDQRFDIRVEGTGLGPVYGYSATLKINGVATSFSSGEGDPNLTDGISSIGWGGFNRRGYSLSRPGAYTFEASFSSSLGTKTITQSIVIEKLVKGDGEKIKNIIFMLGDGMSISHRTAARMVRYGVQNGNPKGWLAMDTFPTQGMVTTSSLNSFVTDSAPGMSGYTTGSHHNNNQEGVFPAQVMNPFLQPRVEYLSEYMHRTQGKVTGIVTTADVEDATPASMAAHTGNRSSGTGITDQFFDEGDVNDTGNFGTGLKVLLGGGRQWFLPAGSGSGRSTGSDYGPLPADLVAGWNLPAAAAGALDPGRNLLGEFTAAGFAYAPDLTTLNALVPTAGSVPTKLLGLFKNSHMNVAIDKIANRRGRLIDNAIEFAVRKDGYPDQPMLDEMASAALRVMSQYQKGFVLLIEGASIDKQAHAQDADRSIGDTIEFDRAVGVAKAFAAQDKHTLVLVLSDHECSGFSVIGGLRVPGGTNAGSMAYLNGLAPGVDNLVTSPASDPARQKMVGTYDAAGNPVYDIRPDGYPATFNVDGKVLIGFGASANRYETWLTRPLPGGSGIGGFESGRGFLLRGQADRNSSAVHTAADVPVSAFTTNANAHRLFSGTYENIDVFFRAMGALGARSDD